MALIIQKSYRPTVPAGVPARVTVSTSIPTTIKVDYDGVTVLPETAITDTYSFDYVPPISGGILTLWTEASGVEFGDDLVQDNWTEILRVNNLGGGVYDFFTNGLPFGSEKVLYFESAEISAGEKFKATFTTSGTYFTPLRVIVGNVQTDISTNGTHTFEVEAVAGGGDSDQFRFEADYQSFGFVGTVSDITLQKSEQAKVTGTISMVSLLPNYHTPYNNGAGVIKFKEGKNGWTSQLSFSPEVMVSLDNDLYSFNKGLLWRHTNEEVSFYDNKNVSVLGFRVSGTSGVVKLAKYLSIDSNIRPDYIHVQCNNPYLQATDLCPTDLVYSEGSYQASFFRDKLSPNFDSGSQSQDFANALINGDTLRAKFFDVFFIFNNQEDFRLSSVDFGFQNSSGHHKQK